MGDCTTSAFNTTAVSAAKTSAARLARTAATAIALAGLFGFANRPALACGGFAEYGGSCNDADTDASNEAQWMLNRVVVAVKTDETHALDEFNRGADGFRTQDIYVFCVGPDGRMSAHPDGKLRGGDAQALRDPTGKAFINEMLEKAKEGQVAEVHYLFPRPGSTVPVPKTSFVTRVKDQMCGVGYYEANASADAAPAAPQPAAALASPTERLAALRQRLDAGIPDNLRPEWTAFLSTLDEQHNAEQTALAKAREAVQAAETLVSASPSPAR